MFISLLNRFKDSKNQALVASVYLFLSEYNDAISIEAIAKELRFSKKNIETAATYLLTKNYIEISGKMVKIKNNIVLDEEEAETRVEIIKNTTAKDSMFTDCSKILDHLSNLTGTRFSRNSIYDKMITKQLKDGYTLEDFYKVNQYFALEWNNPEMSKYIVPKTLYNSYFPARVDESRIFFSDESAELYAKAGEILRFFAELRAKHNLPIFQPSSKDYKNVVFWVRKFSDTAIIALLKNLFEEWGNDAKFSVHLLPNIVFSDKFQLRMETFLSKQKTVENQNNNENIDQLFNYLQKIQTAVLRNQSITKTELLNSVSSQTLSNFLIFIKEDENMNKIKNISNEDLIINIKNFFKN